MPLTATWHAAMRVVAMRDGVADRAQWLAAAAGGGATDVLAAARALERAGRPVIHLEVGEPDVPTPSHVVEAAVRALRDGQTRYAPAAGLPELRAAAADALAGRGVPADPGRVVVGPGARALLFATLLAVVQSGDEVLVPDPGYGAYAATTAFAGGCAVPYAFGLDQDQPLDVDALGALVTPRTRVLVLNAPHNPTGATLDDPALDAIAELAHRHDLLVVSDEIYARHVYGDPTPANGLATSDLAAGCLTNAHPSVAGRPGLTERTVVVDGLSKAYAMTGWRLGYACLPTALVAPVTALVAQSATCTAPFVQHAGVAALTGPQDAVAAQVASLRARRDLLVAGLDGIAGVRCAVPRGAFYAFPELDGDAAPRTADAVARRMLDEFGVAVVPGRAFGRRGQSHLRFAYTAPSEQLTAAVDALRACMVA